MKNMKRILLTVVAAMLLVVMSVAGTLAYLTSTSENVINTFTVGNVAIKLNEAKIIGDGTDSDHDDRVTANQYKLQPGLTYHKDPTVTVSAGSEKSYIRILVTVKDYDALKAAFPQDDDRYTEYWNGNVFLLQKLVGGWDGNVWPCAGVTVTGEGSLGNATAVYEFRYYQIVDEAAMADNDADIKEKQLPDLFKTIIMPGDMTNNEISALSGVSINLVAHAIQAEGFADQAAAWEAWTDATKNGANQ